MSWPWQSNKRIYIDEQYIFLYAAHIWFGGSREEYCRGAVIIPADLFGAIFKCAFFPRRLAGIALLAGNSSGPSMSDPVSRLYMLYIINTRFLNPTSFYFQLCTKAFLSFTD